jgi:hypothetical protein
MHALLIIVGHEGGVVRVVEIVEVWAMEIRLGVAVELTGWTLAVAKIDGITLNQCFQEKLEKL